MYIKFDMLAVAHVDVVYHTSTVLTQCHETKKVHAWTFFLLVRSEFFIVENSISYFLIYQLRHH